MKKKNIDISSQSQPEIFAEAKTKYSKKMIVKKYIKIIETYADIKEVLFFPNKEIRVIANVPADNTDVFLKQLLETKIFQENNIHDGRKPGASIPESQLVWVTFNCENKKAEPNP